MFFFYLLCTCMNVYTAASALKHGYYKTAVIFTCLVMYSILAAFMELSILLHDIALSEA